MLGKELKNTLKLLIQEAALVDANLEKRLKQINRWLKNLKPGTLNTKKFLVLFLIQIIKDSQIFITLKKIENQEKKQFYYEQLTPTEKYWYDELFPRWLNQNDPKYKLWKQKLMSGELIQQDMEIIANLVNTVESRGGTVLQRYIVDLSMATDLIVSFFQEKALCIQVTTLSGEFYQKKYEDWQNTLQTWNIDRGLFLSYNPSEQDLVNIVTNILLYNSDHLKTGKYLRFDL